ncbi:MAG: transporter substrate-binding domain-containing protein [Ruminococcaceae bacterium]|nr:transporter substrate-binding domain-containing protein [Oscillospiraceae bacterium]
MKKFLALMLAVMMCVAFAGCTASESDRKVSIAAKTSTLSAEITKEYAAKYGFDIAYYEDSPTMYQAVMNGTNDACYEDRSVIGWAIKESGLNLRTVGEIERPAEYGFAVKKGTNPELIAMFNAGLANIKASGEYDEILAKYGYLENPCKDESAARVESGVKPTKKYVIYSDNAFAPFEYLDINTNQYVGVDMDILAAVAKDQGFEYVVKNEGFDAAMGAVQAGQADGMIAGMTITDERRENFDFSDGYFEDGQILVVPADSNITSIEDFAK